MDALVEEALKKVKEAVKDVADKQVASRDYQKKTIARAINAVDALKSALKTL